jgi:hypothetical protein
VTRPTAREPEGRILPFRRPASLRPRNTPPAPAVPDLEKYERKPDEPDDFGHRMLMNGLGLAVTAVLVLAGLWMADVMAHMRKDQDCVLIGRMNCSPIDVRSQTR